MQPFQHHPTLEHILEADPFQMDPLTGIAASQQELAPFAALEAQAPTTQEDPALPPSNAPLTGIYSNSGFDMIGILSRIVNRPNPQINLGPIDMSCSFLVTDNRQYDCPIVYCSPNFETLTGYRGSEIVGRNCRFLQAPDGQVTGGSRRTHTDNLAVYHLKSYLLQKKEHQASIINYRKGGQPFVNLVTVIPVPDEFNQTAFFVGLQVDLVEQPNAILEKMKDGTYSVNYQQINIPPYIPGNGGVVDPVDAYFHEIPTGAVASSMASPDILGLVACSGENEQQLQQEWNRLLIDQTVDFVHVLSLKGFFLYCSRSCATLLEYDPEELLGHSLSAITHPSDIVPVMRDIKDAAGDSEHIISLLFRVRRKYSGYMWMECQGRLHIDQSKGRKCLILAGRERPVYRLPVKEVIHANASIADAPEPTHSADPLLTEFWAKMTLEGLYLRVTPPSEDVLGYPRDALQGSSMYRYAGDGHITDITHALHSVSQGHIVHVKHTMRNQRGQYLPVVSTFYPGDTAFGVGKPTFALAQTRLQTVEEPLRVSGAAFVDPARPGDENIFSEIEPVRGTSWQYELHQLQQANARLRAQIEKATTGKHKKSKKKKATTSSDNEPKMMCAHCHRTDSPEWRKGPNGPKELCNACGLKYAKATKTREDEVIATVVAEN